MRPLVSMLWRWRWFLAAGAVVAAVAGSYLRWRSEQTRVDGLLSLAEEAIAAREYDVARQRLNTYLESRPHDARARLHAARTARRLHQYDEAAENLRKCREDSGDIEAIEIEYALIAVEQGDPSAVPALWARVTEIDDELSLVILEVLIQHDLDLYRLRAAQQGFNLYLARRPNDLNALLGRGRLWERLLSFADAVVDYRHAVTLYPNNNRARRWLAAALLVVGTPVEALEQYQWLAARHPDDPVVRLGLAKCHRELGQVDEALLLLNQLLESSPNNGEALWQRGQLEMDRNRPADALSWLTRAEKAAPHDRRVVFSLFSCLQALGRTAEAEVVNKRLAQIDADLRRLDEIRPRIMSNPMDVALRCEGGKIFLRNGEREEGIRWLKIALQVDPTCTEARRILMTAQ